MSQCPASPAGEVLGHVVHDLEQVFGALDTLGRRLHDVVAQANAVEAPVHRSDLTPLHEVIFDILANHRDLVAGAGVILAPELLLDAPRWLEWWWTTAAGTPEALRVNLDPECPRLLRLHHRRLVRDAGTNPDPPGGRTVRRLCLYGRVCDHAVHPDPPRRPSLGRRSRRRPRFERRTTRAARTDVHRAPGGPGQHGRPGYRFQLSTLDTRAARSRPGRQSGRRT